MGIGPQNDELPSFLYLRFTEYLHLFLIIGDSRRVKSQDVWSLYSLIKREILYMDQSFQDPQGPEP